MKPFFVKILLKHKHDIIVVGFIFYGNETASISISRRKFDVFTVLSEDHKILYFVSDYLQSLEITYKTLTFEKIAEISKISNNVIYLTYPVYLQEVDKNESEMIEKLYERYL